MKKFLVIMIMMLMSNQVFAECLTPNNNLFFDTSNNCSSEPKYNRIIGSQIIEWNGTALLFANIGNEIAIYNIGDYTVPKGVASSGFNVGNVGDSDYDLLNFSVCSNCRYGVAVYKKGIVLFDMGTGTYPKFAEFRKTLDSRVTPGAFTFMYDGQQYLIADKAVDTVPVGYEGVFIFNRLEDLEGIARLYIDGRKIQILNGYNAGEFLYLGDKSQQVHIFRTSDFDYVSTPWQSYMVKDKGLSVDFANNIAVEARSTGAYVWDITGRSNPVHKTTIPGDYNRSAIAWPILFVAKNGFKNSERTFMVSGEPVAEEFWDSENQWNWPESLCSPIQAAASFKDKLYLLRFSRGQVAAVGDCDNSLIFKDGFESGSTGGWN